MKHISIILFVLLAAKCTSQPLIDRNRAMQIARENGINEPLDSLTAILKGDIWEIKSIYCDEQSVTYRIDAKTGNQLTTMIQGLSVDFHSNFKPRSEIQLNFVDSLIPVNINNPRILLPDYFETESKPVISPDNKWIAFSCGFRAIAIASPDGKVYRKICDDCLSPVWTYKENTLVYEKNFKQICEHNIESDNIKILSDPYSYSRYSQFSYDPSGKRIAFVQSPPREPEDSRLSMEGDDYELYIYSISNNKEKRITHLGRVHSPVWNLTGDTLFFYSELTAYYATDFNSAHPKYSVARQIGKASIWDYVNSTDNKFLYKLDCKLVLVDLYTLKPVKYIIRKPGRYMDFTMSKDGRYTVYTLKKGKQDKIYIVEN